MCGVLEVGLALDLCLLAGRSFGIFYLFLLALVLMVIAAYFLAWKQVEPLVSPYRNEMGLAEELLAEHYDGSRKLSAGELQGLWQAIGLGTLSRALIVTAVLIPLLLIAR